jgi:hypothetical protein
MKKNQLDLHLSAAAVAKANVDAENEFTVEKRCLDTFQSEGGDPKDWAFWKTQHDNTLSMYRRFKLTLALSTAEVRPPTPVQEKLAKAVPAAK